MWEFAVGNAAEWATVLIAAVALFFAAKAWKASQGMLELEQTRENRAERRELERQRADDQAAQADLIGAWIEATRVSSQPNNLSYADRWTLHLLNGSLLPVYNVKVTYVSYATLDPERGVSSFRVLPPGPKRRPLPNDLPLRAIHRSGSDELVQETPEDLQLIVEFTDSAGREWRRGSEGAIDRLN